MKYLIFTQPDDTHAMVTQAALQSLGHEVQLLFSADQPTRLTHSIWVQPSQLDWQHSDLQSAIAMTSYDVIWSRRARHPYIPKTEVHAADYEFICRENRVFFEALMTLISPEAWWVNPQAEAKRANAKLYQLHMAQAAGLSIPITLGSNDPSEIRAFLKQHHKTGVIYKALCPGVWAEQSGLKALYTTVVTEAQLPSDEVLRLTPGLFQPLIPKAYELRITCFGSHCVAVRIDSQQHARGRVDWRAIPSPALPAAVVQLPMAIRMKLSALMRSLGLMFGCIDMIVTPTGEYVFLEVNEQGQFLWLEELLPDVYLFDRWIQFLVQRTFDFHWEESAVVHRLMHYREPLQQLLQLHANQHVLVSEQRLRPH